MNIEDFINENRLDFCGNALPEGHRERFLRMLRNSGIVMENEYRERSGRTESLLTIWYSVAAAAVVTIAVVISGFGFGKNVTEMIPKMAGSQVVELRHFYDRKVDEAIESLEDVMADVDDTTRVKITKVIDNLVDMGDVFTEIAPLPEEKQMAIVEQIYDNRIKTIERISENVKR
ncbi:MAG: hypothetical protein MJ000_09270 [Bacteroidales bacterium]|nr:hypothetical protein [Bacteroidales bacterium]